MGNKNVIIKIIENCSPELAAEEILALFSSNDMEKKCSHKIVHKENAEQSYGTCLACGTTVLNQSLSLTEK